MDPHALTLSASKGKRSTLKLVIFHARASSLFRWILLASLLQLVQDDCVGIKTQLVREQHAIGQHISQLVLCRFKVSISPLEALEQFRRFDGDALREILGSVELLPIAFCHELSECVANRVFVHNFKVSATKGIGTERCEAQRIKS